MNQGEQKHFKTDAVDVDSSSSRARVRAVFVLVCVDKFLLLHTHIKRAHGEVVSRARECGIARTKEMILWMKFKPMFSCGNI